MIYLKKGRRALLLKKHLYQVLAVQLRLKEGWVELPIIRMGGLMVETEPPGLPKHVAISDDTLYFFPRPARRYACKVVGTQMVEL
jgi:hypothetical protein